jgi:hypothetical protein
MRKDCGDSHGRSEKNTGKVHKRQQKAQEEIPGTLLGSCRGKSIGWHNDKSITTIWVDAPLLALGTLCWAVRTGHVHMSVVTAASKRRSFHPPFCHI